MCSLVENISNHTDTIRLQIGKKSDANKSELEQYFSSAPIARLMASMMDYAHKEINILDPGAGVGSLFVACIEEIIYQGFRPKKISVTAYEIDKSLFVYLRDSLRRCSILCKENGISFSSKLINKDFITDSILNLKNNNEGEFSHIIINPPYKKINTYSKTYKILSEFNLQSTNLYTTFVTLSEEILKDSGEMVFISPRSFCNGPYFQSFRKKFLESMSLKRIHIFDSRSSSFKDDNVLQENIIVHAIKNKTINNVLVSSTSSNDKNTIIKHAKKSVVYPDDPQRFIHIVSDKIGIQISKKMRQLKSTLKDLNIDVSTGRVIDFRIKGSLRHKQSYSTVPLVRPFNLLKGSIVFPIQNKKENHIENTKKSQNLLIKNGNYVLVKRFTTKEEKKRIVSSVWHGNEFDFPLVGFENKINYFHSNGNSLGANIANGLSLFLNSSLVDIYFRQFNGHTQVNATDLRYIRYPTFEQLKTLNSMTTNKYLEQKKIDDVIEKVLFGMSGKPDKIDPIPAKQKIDEAIDILKQLGFPKQQQNNRSALTLLALLDLKPHDTWKKSKASLIGITPMMEFFKKHYDKKYAPNSRETVRRHTVHQFLQASLIVKNPCKPDRPTNSGKTVYRINEESLKLIQSYGSPKWKTNLTDYEKITTSLKKQYAKERKMQLIPLQLPDGKLLELSTGGHNILVKKICNKFGPSFTPGGIPLYIGDTRKKFSHYYKKQLEDLNITINPHGKIPDVIIYYPKKKLLVLIEAVATHGPIDSKRRKELDTLFSKSKVELVYVTAFSDFRTFKKYFEQIAWESEVWIAEAPSHMIHFNGSKFMGKNTP